MNYFTVIPLEENCFEIWYELCSNNADGTISTLDIVEVWRTGKAFVNVSVESNFELADDEYFYIKHEQEDCRDYEFENKFAIYFDFSSDINEVDQQEFKQCYYHGDKDMRTGKQYIHEGSHGWSIIDKEIRISPPMRVDLFRPDGAHICEVKLHTRNRS